MFEELLAANTAYAEGFTLAGIAPVAARGFALVTCMDSRIEPLTMLGLHPGDAKILRNAGARVTPDVLRSLVLATRFLDVREIAVMQHTNCALAGESDDGVRARLEARGPRTWRRGSSWPCPTPTRPWGRRGPGAGLSTAARTAWSPRGGATTWAPAGSTASSRPDGRNGSVRPGRRTRCI